MTFVKVLAGLFQLSLDFDGDSVRPSIPPPFNENEGSNEPVPNIIDMQEDWTPRPVYYELKNEEGDEVLPL